jgi:hypothetical protein
MAALDAEIDALNAAIMEAEKALGDAQNNFDDFLGSLELS